MAKDAYRDPIYNLKAVVEKTGVSADALRAWERRYGLPDPARTAASHRVYSRRDIDVIKWLVARQDEGLRIGRAVKLWRSLEGEGQDPLRSMPFPSDTRRERLAAGDTIAELREAWLSSSMAFDEQAAEQALTRAFAMYPPDMVCSQIISDGIAQVGQRWGQGEITPQQEHFASHLAVRRLESLLAAAPPPTRRGRILTASPPAEAHTIGLLTMTLLLRRAGWDVVYLGADVPVERMEQTVEAAQPDLVILSAEQLHSAASLLDMARLTQRRDLPLAFAGRIFDQAPQLRGRIPGHFLGSSFEQALQEVERLMTSARRTPDVMPTPEAAARAGEHFVDRRTDLEAAIWRVLRAEGFDRKAVDELNQFLGRNVAAALVFGSMDLLGDELDWLEELDASQRPPREQIDRYLQAYYDAAEKTLDERGSLIVGWLEKRLGETTGR